MVSRETTILLRRLHPTIALARAVIALGMLLAPLIGFAAAAPQGEAEPAVAGEPAAATEPAPVSEPAAAGEPVFTDAGDAADDAVRDWLSRTPLGFDELASLDAEQLCRELPGLVSQPPPPEGTEVNLADRVDRPQDDKLLRVFTYSAVRPGDQLDVVEVRLAWQDDHWATQTVGFHSTTELTGVRAWLQTQTASWLFMLFTALVVWQALARGSRLRRWLASGRVALAEHRRLVLITVIGLYTVFALGVSTGTTLPESCDAAVLEIVNSAITSLGATQAYGSGDIARAAVTTFYQNFVVVTVSVTFTLAAILGVPAYLYAIFSFFVQGVPFGLLGGGSAAQIVTLLVVILLELTAYFLVVAGGGMLLATVWKRGFAQLSVGFRKLLLTLPIAMLLLLAGAWFEAASLILGF